MKDSQTYGTILKDYVIWAEDQDFCEQCVRPWNDGECSCENKKSKQDVQRRDDACAIAFLLIKKGIDINSI